MSPRTVSWTRLVSTPEQVLDTPTHAWYTQKDVLDTQDATFRQQLDHACDHVLIGLISLNLNDFGHEIYYTERSY